MERNLLRYIWKLLVGVCFDLDALLMCLGTECLVMYFLKLLYFDIWCFMFCEALCCSVLVHFMPLVEIHCCKQNFDLTVH